MCCCLCPESILRNESIVAREAIITWLHYGAMIRPVPPVRCGKSASKRDAGLSQPASPASVGGSVTTKSPVRYVASGSGDT